VGEIGRASCPAPRPLARLAIGVIRTTPMSSRTRAVRDDPIGWNQGLTVSPPLHDGVLEPFVAEVLSAVSRSEDR
jgi:hypothetical protein